uniref:Uncharacterized protein n=1 Tax=Cebus imitator TaxID=2715852 RepID=A0A2K5PYL8_CEBIM
LERLSVGLSLCQGLHPGAEPAECGADSVELRLSWVFWWTGHPVFPEPCLPKPRTAPLVVLSLLPRPSFFIHGWAQQTLSHLSHGEWDLQGFDSGHPGKMESLARPGPEAHSFPLSLPGKQNSQGLGVMVH